MCFLLLVLFIVLGRRRKGLHQVVKGSKGLRRDRPCWDRTGTHKAHLCVIHC